MPQLTIPPLRQSAHHTMACPYSYGLVYVDGMRSPDTAASVRGTEIHAVLAQYVAHCAKRQIPADLAYLDSIMQSCGDEASQILEVCRDSMTVDWANLFGVEMGMGLDEDFRPTVSVEHDGTIVPLDAVWGLEPGGECVYSGILDAVYLMPGGQAGRVIDFKSHGRPFEADTFQSRLYSLFLFAHLPDLQEIEFVLRFVRYPSASKLVKFHREDMPKFMEEARRVRARQLSYHAQRQQGKELQAIGSAACEYCPCKLNPVDFACPLSPLNPAIDRTPAEWLSTKLAAQKVLAVAESTLRQTVEGTGRPVRSQDANGKWYEFGEKPSKTITAPLFEEDGQGGICTPILGELLEWFRNNPSDLIPARRGSAPWPCKLKIGWTQLRSYLSNAKGEPVKKRALIHQRIMDLVKIEPTIKYGVTVDAELSDDTTLEADGGEPEEMMEF